MHKPSHKLETNVGSLASESILFFMGCLWELIGCASRLRSPAKCLVISDLHYYCLACFLLMNIFYHLESHLHFSKYVQISMSMFPAKWFRRACLKSRLRDLPHSESPGQWFWNVSAHQNFLKDVLNHRLLGPTPRISDSADLEWGLRICIFNHRPRLEDHCYKTGFFNLF